MKIYEKNKGITLIALVITIVVLIILASVAITLSLGDNGIFKKATKAKEDTLTAQNEEAMQIAEATNSIDGIVGSSRDTVTLTTEKYNDLVSKTTPLRVDITDVASGWKITNNSVRIGNMVYVDIIFERDSGWTVGWNNNIGKISVTTTKDIYLLTVHTWNGCNNGEIYINQAGDISLYEKTARGGTGDMIVCHATYYVGE